MFIPDSCIVLLSIQRAMHNVIEVDYELWSMLETKELKVDYYSLPKPSVGIFQMNNKVFFCDGLIGIMVSY